MGLFKKSGGAEDNGTGWQTIGGKTYYTRAGNKKPKTASVEEQNVELDFPAMGSVAEPEGENSKYQEMIRKVKEDLGESLAETAIFDIVTSQVLATADRNQQMLSEQVCSMVKTINEFQVARAGEEQAKKLGSKICRTAIYPLENGKYCVLAIVKNIVWVLMLDKMYGKPGVIQAELLKEIRQWLKEA